MDLWSEVEKIGTEYTLKHNIRMGISRQLNFHLTDMKVPGRNNRPRNEMVLIAELSLFAA
jgi:hypothetical protein